MNAGVTTENVSHRIAIPTSFIANDAQGTGLISLDDLSQALFGAGPIGASLSAIVASIGAVAARVSLADLKLLPVTEKATAIVMLDPDIALRGIYAGVGGQWIKQSDLPADAAILAASASAAARDLAKTYADRASAAVDDIASEKEVPIYTSIASLANVSVNADQSIIRVNGRASGTDAEGGLFTTVNTGSSDSFLSGDGRTWYRVSDDKDTAWFRLKNLKLLAAVGYALLAGTAISIVCQGDSLTYGQDTSSTDVIAPLPGAPTTRSPIQYPERMGEQLNAWTNSQVTVINRGYPGDTAKLSWQRWVTKPAAQLAILMLGTNDANAVAGATFAEYCAYYERIVRQYIAWGIAVVIATPNAVSLNNANITQAQFGQFAKSLADAYGCPIFDSVEVLQYCYQPDVYSDSIHLNKYGYAKFGDAIAAFLLSGVLLQQMRPISTDFHFQPMRGTEGIGAFMTGGTAGSTVTQSFVNSGAAMGIAENGGYTMCFYMNHEAADLYLAGVVDGAQFQLSDPVDTSGKGVNRTPMKNAYQRGAVETTSFKAAQYIPGGKTYAGTFVGRGWKTLRVEGKGAGNGIAYINELFIEPKSPYEAGAGGPNFNPAKMEVTVYNKPAEAALLPAAENINGDIAIPLPWTLWGRSNDPANFASMGTVDVEIKVVGTPGTANDGIRKLTLARIDASNQLGIWQVSSSNASVPVPTVAGVGYTEPEEKASSLQKGRYPSVREQGWLWLTFAGTPTGYYQITFKSAAQQGAESTIVYRGGTSS